VAVFSNETAPFVFEFQYKSVAYSVLQTLYLNKRYLLAILPASMDINIPKMRAVITAKQITDGKRSAAAAAVSVKKYKMPFKSLLFARISYSP